MIDDLKALIPESLQSESGAVFYSGRAAFSAPSPLYILGLNPGGSPQLQSDDTVSKHTDMILSGNENWSEYQDEVWWEGHNPGESGMQPRVVHLIRTLGLDPQKTPASNVVFLRSALEKDIASTFGDLALRCWPFHQAVIERLGVRVVLCFGKRAGNWVCQQLNATNCIAEFVEENRRRWRTRVYRNSDGIAVVVATHPSRADWTVRETNPSELVRAVLGN